MVEYKITIEKKSIKTLPPTKSYQKVADTGNDRDGGSVYEYVEKPEDKVQVEEVIYSQIVEDLRLSSVIAAINNINAK